MRQTEFEKLRSQFIDDVFIKTSGGLFMRVEIGFTQLRDIVERYFFYLNEAEVHNLASLVFKVRYFPDNAYSAKMLESEWKGDDTCRLLIEVVYGL